MPLTLSQRCTLEEAGYIVVPDVLSSETVTRLKLAFSDVPDDQSRGTQHVRIDEGTPGREAWDALKIHPVIQAAAAHVLAGPVSVDLHGRNPLPGYGQQGLHTDWMARRAPRPFFVLTALWILDDFTATNGATRVVPGTHLTTRAIPKSFAQPLARHPDETIVEGRSGSVLIFNGHLWHSGRHNGSNGPRRSAQMVLRIGGAAL